MRTGHSKRERRGISGVGSFQWIWVHSYTFSGFYNMSRFICGVWTVLNPERPISTPMHTEITFNHSQLQSVWWLQQRIGTRCCLLEQPESGFFVNHEYWILHPTDATADQITCKKQTRSLEDIKPNSRLAATVPVVAVHMAPRQKGIKHVYKYSKYLAYRLPAVCPQCARLLCNQREYTVPL